MSLFACSVKGNLNSRLFTQRYTCTPYDLKWTMIVTIAFMHILRADWLNEKFSDAETQGMFCGMDKLEYVNGPPVKSSKPVAYFFLKILSLATMFSILEHAVFDMTR